MNEKDLNINEDIIDEGNTEGLGMEEMLEEMLSDLLKVEVDTSSVQGIQIDDKEFAKGIKDLSRVAGRFTVLKNVGMSEEAIITYLINDRNIEHSKQMQQIINAGQIQFAKTQSKAISMNEESHQV